MNEGCLFVALDVDREAQGPLLRALPSDAAIKVGMEAFYRDGASIVRDMVARRGPVFLDLKLHDIPNTVSRAVSAVADLGVSYLTVHASGGPEMIRAAVDAAGGRVGILGVTLLTSLTGNEFGGLWAADLSPEDRVEGLARLAIDAGCAGVVASPREAARLRRVLGDKPAIVCPGIRPASPSGASSDDQQRTATAAQAVADGASHLVVGRPITQASDPGGVYRALRDEMSQGRSNARIL